eukprot:4342782-Alexandrium_andersonii.AAC.1
MTASGLELAAAVTAAAATTGTSGTTPLAWTLREVLFPPLRRSLRRLALDSSRMGAAGQSRGPPPDWQA